MIINKPLLSGAKARDVVFTNSTLTVHLCDGRTISVPLEWYPRLLFGTAAERRNWRLISGGEGIYWSELNEDVSVDNLIQGKPSGESYRSLKQWLEHRAKRR